VDFPTGELRDESAGFDFLLGRIHLDGLICPHCGDRDHRKLHRRDRAPIILAYRCTACRRISTAFTKTVFQGTKRRTIELVLILRGIAHRSSPLLSWPAS